VPPPNTRTSATDQRVACSGPLTGAEAVTQPPIGKRQQVFAHGYVQICALAGLVAASERKKDIYDGWVGAAGNICRKHGRNHECAVTAGTEAENAGFRHVVQVMCGNHGFRAILPPSRNRAID
jgi:hypothetical protein